MPRLDFDTMMSVDASSCWTDDVRFDSASFSVDIMHALSMNDAVCLGKKLQFSAMYSLGLFGIAVAPCGVLHLL